MIAIDFFVPGFSKCGTTTLCAMLAEHPDLFVPDEKEPNFFAHAFGEGWDWYAKFFEPARPGQKLGDGSTFYSTAEAAETACARIVQHYPETRFLFIARNPIKRLESSYREMHHSGECYGIDAPYSIGEALRQFPNMIEDTLYWQRLSVYRNHVPDDRIHVLFLEDFRRQAAKELVRCFEFLGVDPSPPRERLDQRLNAGEDKMYDSRLMRFIRRRAWLRGEWNRLSDYRKRQFSRWLRLRRPFTQPIVWDAKTREWVKEQLDDDMRRLLAYCGKPGDFWQY
jgi:hypothetical protein